MPRIPIAVAVVALALPLHAGSDPEREARAALERKDWPAFITATEALVAQEPQRIRHRYNLACAYARGERPADAIRTLGDLADRGIALDPARDPDLASLRERPDFDAVVARMARAAAPLAVSEPAFRLPQKDLVAEGVAWDGARREFLVSSVHRRTILRVGKDGTARPLVASGQDGLRAAQGLAVDEKARLLYVCSSGVPEMQSFTKEDEGRADLFVFGLDDGSLRRRIPLPGPGAHNCNDVGRAADGTIYVSDAGTGAVWALAPGAATLRTVVAPGALRSPGGLVPAPDGRSLYVADWTLGLARVDLATGAVRFLEPPRGGHLAGIDGLVRLGDQLVAIQNAYRPHRVARLTLDGDRVSRVEVVERAHPLYAEPTLGVIVEGDLYYVANSQWGSFDQGAIWPESRLQETVILRLPLTPR